MGTANVWILGGYQSDFARNLTREGLDFADLTAEVVDNTLSAAKVDATAIEVVHVANAFGEMFARQGHLGAMPASVNDGLWDTPAARHEAACASGSVATLAALSDLRSGAYRTALVVGVELEKTVPGDTAAQHLGAAAWTGHEGAEAKFMWPYMFDRVADEYDRRYGLDDAHLRAIAQLNFANARANPNAQTREWTVPDPLAADDANPPIEGRLRRFDCSQMTDGGAGIVLVTDDYLRDHPDARPIGRIDGWGHRTVGLGLQQKLDRAADDPYVLPHVRSAVLDALDRARVTLDDVDGLRGARLLHPQRVPRHRPHRAHRPWRIVESDRKQRDRTRRTLADQPQRGADRRWSPGRRVRRAHARRRRQAGQRNGR